MDYLTHRDQMVDSIREDLERYRSRENKSKQVETLITVIESLCHVIMKSNDEVIGSVLISQALFVKGVVIDLIWKIEPHARAWEEQIAREKEQRVPLT